jgi:poly-beta-1,6-N-acetyl-D-glucosamine synthase
MSQSRIKYIIITPVKNEGHHIRATLESVVRQTVLPREWVIVNDGSVDQTEQIITEYSRGFPWIRILNAPFSNRSRGGHVVRLFLSGLSIVQASDYEYLVKLDGDVSFAPTFFEEIFDFFARAPRLGISSGISHTLEAGALREEKSAAGHTLGATKVYKRECYEEIGGLVASMGWDGIDELRARMMGWVATPVPNLIVQHHRPEGLAQGLFRSGIERGKGSHFMGYHPLFLLVRAARHMLHPRSFADGAGMLVGYAASALRGSERIADHKLVKYLRRNQIRRLLMSRYEL